MCELTVRRNGSLRGHCNKYYQIFTGTSTFHQFNGNAAIENTAGIFCVTNNIKDSHMD